MYMYVTYYPSLFIAVFHCTGKLYGDVEYVEERHRHRYEINPKLVSRFEEKGMRFVGQDVEGERMEIMELSGKSRF